MFIAPYKHIVPTGRRIASRLIAITIVTSFLAVLLPVISASANSNTMACCVGKTAGHCESGIAAEKVPEPEPEPMCGLTNPHAEDDGITIVAEPENKPHHAETTSSSNPAVESTSVGRPCEMDCCACAVASSRRPRRDDGAEFIAWLLAPLATASQFESVSLSFSSNEDWKHTSPRGPPISLL